MAGVITFAAHFRSEFHVTTVAVIPVKQLENAKQRLSGLLSAEQRQLLFSAMYRDVLEAATTCDRIDRVVVVTNDSKVADIALEYGAEVRDEPAVPGLIEAVTETSAQLRREGVANMVFLPADIPLVSVEELEVVLDGFGRTSAPEFMIVPASDLGGSNCVVCSPPDCVTFGFGEDSFRRHLRLARERNIEPAVARLPGIGLDIDTPDDLLEAATEIESMALETNTARFLKESGLMDRLSEGLMRIG